MPPTDLDYASALAQVEAATEAVSKLTTDTAEDEALRKEAKALLAGLRAPSKAHLIGGMRREQSAAEPSTFFSLVAAARSTDYAEQAQAKAALQELSTFAEVPGFSKATLGLTDATGGWVISNAIVAEMTKVGMYRAPVLGLVTSLRGMGGVYQVDLPWRADAPDRAVIAAWGDIKQNKDLVYSGYTATMYTLARIYDVSKQFLRKSAGAAEQDIMGELAHAFALGQAYYILNGAGTTEPYGLRTALTGAGAFVTTHTAATTTVVGSIVRAVGIAAAALFGRNRKPEAALLSPTAYGQLVTSGSDTAGFWLNGLDGTVANAGFAAAQPFVHGIPVYPDPSMGDDLIVGEFSALKVFYGEQFRVDTSDVANTRWDYNLVGFRGEMEMGLDARPAVYAGAFERVLDVVA